MIFVTGDVHGDKTRFKDVKKSKIKKGDTLLICGDFGFVWDNSRKEKSILKWIGKRKYNVLFVDGYNDNTELLLEYPQQAFCGGQTKIISNNLRMLMRGEVFEIEGKRIFAFGGGDSEEREHNTAKDALRLPNDAEMQNGIQNLKQINNVVDFIITYDAPAKLKLFLNMESNELTHLHQYLEDVKSETKFTHWYFGKYHHNKVIPPCYTNVFTNILKIT